MSFRATLYCWTCGFSWEVDFYLDHGRTEACDGDEAWYCPDCGGQGMDSPRPRRLELEAAEERG